MALLIRDEPAVSDDLLEALRSFPAEREVTHCGQTFPVSAFSISANCPHCGARIKLRAFSAEPEVEDVFDAVLERLLDPDVRRNAERRQREIQADLDEE